MFLIVYYKLVHIIIISIHISYFQATNELVGRTPETTPEEMRMIVESAHKAFLSWRQTSISTRIRYMFNLQQLIQKHTVSHT